MRATTKTEYIVKGIDKTVRDFAIKHRINIRRDWNNDYMLLVNGIVVDMSFNPTAKSAICMMKRYLRNNNK